MLVSLTDWPRHRKELWKQDTNSTRKEDFHQLQDANIYLLSVKSDELKQLLFDQTLLVVFKRIMIYNSEHILNFPLSFLRSQGHVCGIVTFQRTFCRKNLLADWANIPYCFRAVSFLVWRRTDDSLKHFDFIADFSFWGGLGFWGEWECFSEFFLREAKDEVVDEGLKMFVLTYLHNFDKVLDSCSEKSCMILFLLDLV